MRRLIVLLAMMLGLVVACGQPQTIQAQHNASISCNSRGSVVVTASNYNDGQYSVNGAPFVPFQGGFSLLLDGNSQQHIVITASDWPTFDETAGPCEQPTTTSTTTPDSSSTSSTSTSTSSTTSSTTSTSSTSTTSTTLPPRPSLFGVDDFATCANGAPAISITFGVRPELNGLIGQLSIISLPNGLTVVSNQSLMFVSGGTTVIPYPAVAAGTTSATLNYTLSGEFATASVGPPPTNCAEETTTTTTVLPTTTTTTIAGTTTTTVPATTTTVCPNCVPSTTATTTTLAPPTTLAPAVTTTTMPPVPVGGLPPTR